MANWNELKNYLKDDEELYIAIREAFEKLYTHDAFLIYHDDPQKSHTNTTTVNNHAGERSVVFRFAYYLQNELSKISKYSELNLDCEYNRKGVGIKRIPGFENGIYPDVILHTRNEDKNNILIIEFKSYWNDEIDRDEEKIKSMINISGDYKYKYGIVVIIGQTIKKLELNLMLRT